VEVFVASQKSAGDSGEGKRETRSLNCFHASRFLDHGKFFLSRTNFPATKDAMFQYVASAKDKPWQAGPYDGVELMVLHKNEKTGGVVVLRKFKAGTHVPAHTHPDANEHVYILSGEWVEEDVSYTTGAFFFAPRGQKHGPHFARTEVISVTMFDGPLTIV
jgi:quercetin dioxygenase-like cupin family protein